MPKLILLEEYKRKIKEGFFPKREFEYPKFSQIKKILSTFKKLCNDPKNIGDLMLYYVECGVQFTNKLGDIDEPFYNSMALNYEKAFKYIVQHDMYSLFKERLKLIVYRTDGIGWGFHDDLVYIYKSYSDELL